MLLIVIMAFLSPAFLKGRNVANIVKQISINGILQVGMTMVIITGGIDLSVGSVVALSSITAAFFGTAEKDLSSCYCSTNGSTCWCNCWID